MDVNNDVDAETACAVAGSGNIELMQAFTDAQCFQPFYTSRDVNGMSPFLIACQSDRNLEIVKLVVEKTNKPTLCNLIQCVLRYSTGWDACGDVIQRNWYSSSVGVSSRQQPFGATLC